MQTERYVHAFHKYSNRLSFRVKLPSDAFTFLSTLDFLMSDNDDVNLHCVYDLTKEQVELIIKHFDLYFEVETNYFDYQLDCNTVPESKIKTKEELFKPGVLLFRLQDRLDSIAYYIQGSCDCNKTVPDYCLEDIKDFIYEIYQQGVQDGCN